MFFDTLLFPLPESDTAESNPIFSCVYVNQIANAVTTNNLWQKKLEASSYNYG